MEGVAKSQILGTWDIFPKTFRNNPRRSNHINMVASFCPRQDELCKHVHQLCRCYIIMSTCQKILSTWDLNQVARQHNYVAC